MRSVHLQMGAKMMSSLGVILNLRENNTASDVGGPLPSFPGYVKEKATFLHVYHDSWSL